jgi:hypothetical protein
MELRFGPIIEHAPIAPLFKRECDPKISYAVDILLSNKSICLIYFVKFLRVMSDTLPSGHIISNKKKTTKYHSLEGKQSEILNDGANFRK